MKTIAILMMMLVGMLFLTACTEQETAATDTQNQGSSSFQESEPVVKELEVFYVNKQFFPETFFVNQGEHVRLFLRGTDIIYITMPEAKVDGYFEHGYLEFVAKEKGSHWFYCDGCKEPASLVIHVA